MNEARLESAVTPKAVVLGDWTTMGIGGLAKNFVIAKTEAELVQAVKASDDVNEPVLVLGGGSNVLIADEGFPGTVVKVATKGITRPEADCNCGGAIVKVAAGELLDDFVQYAVEHELIGISALSGIPGTVGAAPIQNVGAYGEDVSQTIASVRTWDRETQSYRSFAAADCGFSYRNSIFKENPSRYLILEVAFQFPLGSLAAPIQYPQLAKALGVELGERVAQEKVRAAVLDLRKSKGMVACAADKDSRSCGSFFTNPVLDVARDAAVLAQLPDAAPQYQIPDGTVKVSAAWLIENAGFPRGYGHNDARISKKHTLGLTNQGQASCAQILDLATEIRAGVWKKFHIELVPEPNLINCALPPLIS